MKVANRILEAGVTNQERQGETQTVGGSCVKSKMMLPERWRFFFGPPRP